MALSDWARRKGLKRSQELLGPSIQARAYGVGFVGPDPRRTRLVLLGAVAAVVVCSSVLLKTVVIPGALLLLIVFYAFDRPVSLVVTDVGVVVFSRSQFNGRPKSTAMQLPRGVLSDPGLEKSRSYVHLPAQRLWLKATEHAAIVDSDTGPARAAMPGEYGAPISTTTETANPSGVTAPSAPSASRSAANPPSMTPSAPGWYMCADSFTDQVYWDGVAWTEGRRSSGGGWAVIPVEPS